MGDRLYEGERFPCVDSVIDRLNQIDFRLRQPEEKRRPPERHLAADLRGRRSRLQSDMDDVLLKEALMDRLNLLETRIRQLSQELDRGGSSGGGDSMTAITFSAGEKKPIPDSSSQREVGWPWQTGSGIHQSPIPKKKEAMDPTQTATTESRDQRAAAFRRNEKRRMGRGRLYKRWFQVGC